MPSRSAIVSAAIAISVCACSGESQQPASELSAPAATLPDPYVAPAVGISLQKPASWLYVGTTNHPDPARYSERLQYHDLEQVIGDVFAPLVAMAPHPDPRAGVDPTVSVFFRFAHEPVWLQRHYREHPEVVSDINVKRLESLPAYAVVEPPSLVPLGDQPGAVIRIRYDARDAASGEVRPVQLRIWNTKRDWGYFYVEALLPEPAAAELEEAVGAIVASIHLDPPMKLAQPDPATTANSK